jgi:DNA repair protein RecO (recombination protein O)
MSSKLFKSKGIVFKTLKYGESSLIVDIFTEEKGMRSYIVSGIRSKSSKTKAGLFQLMSILDLIAYDKGDDKLARIKEVRLAYHFQQLPFDIIRSSIGTFLLEVSRYSIQEKEANPDLYQFLESWYTYLDQTEGPIVNAHLVFLVQLSAFIGFQPDPNYREGFVFDLMEGRFEERARSAYFIDKDHSLLFQQLLETDIRKIDELRFNGSQRRVLLESLITYYRLHIDSFPPLKSMEVLREVL